MHVLGWGWWGWARLLRGVKRQFPPAAVLFPKDSASHYHRAINYNRRRQTSFCFRFCRQINKRLAWLPPPPSSAPKEQPVRQHDIDHWFRSGTRWREDLVGAVWSGGCKMLFRGGEESAADKAPGAWSVYKEGGDGVVIRRSCLQWRCKKRIVMPVYSNSVRRFRIAAKESRLKRN